MVPATISSPRARDHEAEPVRGSARAAARRSARSGTGGPRSAVARWCGRSRTSARTARRGSRRRRSSLDRDALLGELAALAPHLVAALAAQRGRGSRRSSRSRRCCQWYWKPMRGRKPAAASASRSSAQAEVHVHARESGSGRRARASASRELARRGARGRRPARSGSRAPVTGVNGTPTSSFG